MNKKNIKNAICRGFLVLAFVGLAAASAHAQNLKSAYFTETFLYRYQSNPAFGNDKGFVSFPALGNFNMATYGNIGVNSVLYNVNGRTTTFLNPDVDTKTFLNRVKTNNHLGLYLHENIMAAGWKAWGGYNSVTIGLRADAAVAVPGDLLRAVKEGIENKNYQIGRVAVNADVFAEIALNHSRNINDQWRVGGSVKLLLGAGNINGSFKKADLNLGVDNWALEVDGEINAAVKGMEFTTDTKTNKNDGSTTEYMSGLKFGNDFGLNGYGLAFDLGAVYTLNPDWEFSLSVLDLGFIHWNHNVRAATGYQKVETSTQDFDLNDDETFNQLGDDLAKLYEFHVDNTPSTRTQAMGATLNVGAQYTLPVYRGLKFGLLNTTRIQGRHTWTDFRLSANVTPAKCFSADVNFGVGTFGCSFGWILNLNVKGFSTFIASDALPGKLAKQGIPLTSNANFNFGINFPF